MSCRVALGGRGRGFWVAHPTNYLCFYVKGDLHNACCPCCSFAVYSKQRFLVETRSSNTLKKLATIIKKWNEYQANNRFNKKPKSKICCLFTLIRKLWFQQRCWQRIGLPLCPACLDLCHEELLVLTVWINKLSWGNPLVLLYTSF